jgi:hypothetical protein
MWLVEGPNIGTDICGERGPPDNGVCWGGVPPPVEAAVGFAGYQARRPRNSQGCGEPDAARAEGRGIVHASSHGCRGDELVKAGRARGKVVLQPAEVVECAVEASGESQALASAGADGRLQVTEKAAGARDS